MKIAVHEIEPGVFVRWPSGRPVMKTFRTSNLHRADGTVIEVDDDPYEAEIRGLTGDLHTFSDEELADMKIFYAEDFSPSKGKRAVSGTERFERVKGKIRQVFDEEDVPPPPPEPTPMEKLAAAGLTAADIESIVADVVAKQGKKK